MASAWPATRANTVWTGADNDAWTSLPSARRHLLPWLAAAWLGLLLLPGTDWGWTGCGDDFACTSWGYVVLFAWLTMAFTLLRGNAWAGAAAPAVAAGTLLVTDQQLPTMPSMGFAALALLTGWSVFEAAAAYRCVTAQRRFLAQRLDAQTASSIGPNPKQPEAQPAASAQLGHAEMTAPSGRAVRMARLLGPCFADPVLRYYLGFRLGWAALPVTIGGWTAILVVLHPANYDVAEQLFYAAVFLVPGLRLAVTSWRWAHRLVRIAGTDYPTIAMTARRHGRWLSLYPAGEAAHGTVPAASVSLMEDPDGAVAPPWTAVEVRGSLVESGPLVIRQGDRILWPFAGTRTGKRFAARVLAGLIQRETEAASGRRLLFDYRPRFWFQVWHRVHARSRVTLWSDGTLRRDSTFHTKQVNLHGGRGFSIDDDGDLVHHNGDRVFSAATVIRVRDRAGRAHGMGVLRGMPLGKRRQLEQLAAGFLAEGVPAPLPSLEQPSDQAPTQPGGSETSPGEAGSSGMAAGSQADRPAEPDHPPSWRRRLADFCTSAAALGMIGAVIITGVMFESGVDSDATDPRLWGALLVCCGLAATGLTALLDRPRSRGQTSVIGLVGLAGLIAIPLFWTSLTQLVGAPEATEPATVTATPRLSTVTVGQTVQAGAFRIRVAAMTCGYIELADLPPAAHGQYCVVVLTATNLRSYPEWLYDADQRLLVASGRSVKGYGLGSQPWDDELPPGHSVRTRLVFDLPKGVRPVGLRLQCFANQDSTREDIATIDLRR